MQSLPKLILTVAASNDGVILITAPLNSLIRLYQCKISIPNNTSVAVAASVGLGIQYYTKSAALMTIYEGLFLPAIAITTIPGSTRMITDFGPVGLLCYQPNSLTPASIYTTNSQNLSQSIAYTLLYNFESSDS